MTLRKSCEFCRDSYSGSETLSTLVTTRLQCGAASSGLHSMPEAVTALSAANFWLVGPLHDKFGGRGRGTPTKGTPTKGYAHEGWDHRLRTVPNLCQSPGKPVSSWRRSGSRRIQTTREKISSPLRSICSRSFVIHDLEKPLITWVFVVERCPTSLPHRRFSRS